LEFGFKRKFTWWNSIDVKALINIILIMLLGILLLTSAGSGVSEKLGLSHYYFVKKQLAFLLVGIFIILFLSALNEKYIRRIIFIGFIATIILLILVILFGDATKGAKRWLNIMGFSLQPSEFLKPFYTCFIAIILSHEKSKINFRIFCICVFFNALIAILLLLQPDFGMTITNTIATFSLFFIAGIKLSWLILVLVIFVCGIYGAYLFFPHVAKRIDKFMDPTNSSNYQVQKSVSSYLNGGFFGKGPGEGTIKYVLPDAHTDFIFAVGAEEFGLIFCMIIIVAFATFILRALWSLTKFSNLFHVYAIFGIIMHFAMQFLFNIGVTLNIFPTKGMTLPFISYGGSSMLAFSIAAGIYLNLSKNRQLNNLSQNKKFFFVEET
jgi:cell division protein FtsW